jgi:O-antigen ligase
MLTQLGSRANGIWRGLRTSPRNAMWTALIVAGTIIASAVLSIPASPWVLLLLVGGAGVAVMLRQPAVGLAVLAALGFTVPLEFGTGTEVVLTAPVFLIPMVTLAWLLFTVWQGSPRLPMSRTTLPIVLFVASGLLSLVAGTVYWNPLVFRPDDLILVQLAQWSVFALSAVIFLVAGDLGRELRWLKLATWIFLILAGLAVLDLYRIWPSGLLGWTRLGQATGTSMFWTWLAALATGQVVFNRRLSAPAQLALVALLIASGYLVWFRMGEWTSAPVPFTVAALTVVLLRIWQRNRVVAIVVGLILLCIAIFLFPVFFEISGGEREFENSWGGRLVLYRAVLELVKDHPILGLGPAAYRHYGYYRSISLLYGDAYYRRPWINSHNNYIDIYAQMGLVGLGVFLWFLIELGLIGWRLSAHFDRGFAAGYVNGVLGGLMGTLVAMMLVDWFLPFVYNVGFAGFRTSALAWMFLGGLVAFEQLARARAN